MVVQHSLSAGNTARQLKINTGKQAKTTEKLSSGYRINRAADDAAGLSISEKLRHQIRGLERGATNSQEGVSLCQVADGALAEVSEILHRITELSVQAANDTNTDSDRRAIQKEIHELLQEIDRIGDTTEYNTQPVFQGGNVLSTGVSNSPVKVNSVSGHSDYTIYNEFNMMDSTFMLACSGDTLTLSTDAEDAYDPITFDHYHSVTSISCKWEDAGLTVTDGVVKAGMYNLTIGDPNRLYIQMIANVERDMSLAEFNQAMDGAKIGHDWYYFGSSYKNNPVSHGFGSLREVGCFFEALKSGKELIEDLDLEWDNPPKDKFKVVMHRDENGNIYGELPNGTRLTGGEWVDDQRAWVWEYKEGNRDYRMRVEYIDITNYDFESVESGFCYELYSSGVRQAVYFTSFIPSANSSTGSGSTADSLTAPKQWWIQSGDTNGNGFFIEIDKMNTHMLGIAKLDVSTGAGAQEAIDLSQKALDKVSENRSKIGAQQNRLEHTFSNVKNTAENAQAAESRIRDADMAKEMVENAAVNILMQAGQSILAQNNQGQNRVLELLS